MRITNIIFSAAVVCLGGCTTMPSRVVTLVEPGKTQFIGKIDYDSQYSGTLTVENGPNGETFTGPFVVVDKTSTHVSKGTVVVPQPTVMPALGTANSSSSGNIDAQGFWYGTGSKGSLLNCILQVGHRGHGHGSCKHSRGIEYEILL